MKPGSKVSEAGYSYVRVGFGEVVRLLALFFFGLLVLAFGRAFAATGIFPWSGRQAVRITRAVLSFRLLDVGSRTPI
ncbi:hypothetical protein ABZT17_30690 [Streptomyces sp. NPDC005648]|uniref:hypothetical protein n=1 Tax=Streptomyces sp. NPDC005648 TaxID=3157044 RepID=UPI0033B4DD6C